MLLEVIPGENLSIKRKLLLKYPLLFTTYPKNNTILFRTTLMLKSTSHEKYIAKTTPIFAHLNVFFSPCNLFYYGQLTDHEPGGDKQTARIQIRIRRKLGVSYSG